LERHVQELEAKFLVSRAQDAGAGLRRFQQSLAWAGFRIQPAGRRTVTDTYYDTSDQQLRSAGWSYRHRRRNGSVTMTLKEINRARSGVFDREEVEQMLPAGVRDFVASTGDLPAGPVLARLESLLQPGAAVAALFTVVNDRTRFRLTHPDFPRAVIDMALDAARLAAHDELYFTEIELELSRGPHEVLAAALDVAELEPGLVPARLSKFQRGLMAAGCPLERRRTAQSRHLDRQSRWLDLAVAHLKSLFYQIKLYEPYAWEGVHPEGVHQMRVATRRTLAALETFTDALPAAERQSLEAGLRWLAGRLGAVRDLDVHLAHLDRYDDVVRPSQRIALDRYRSYVEARHRQARCELLEALDGDAYLALVADFRQLLAAARQPEHAVAVRIDDAVRTALPPLINAVIRRGRAIDDDVSARKLHRLRKRVKRLRYPLEFLGDVYDGELAQLQKRLRRLQQHLGIHQDAVVARAELADYRAQQTGKRARRMLARLDRHEQRRARRARGRCARAWRKFERAAGNLTPFE
jgi:CHAD domain-containing protein